MIPVLANADVQQRLIPLLPEAAELPKTEAELRETMHSPQFQQVRIDFWPQSCACRFEVKISCVSDTFEFSVLHALCVITECL